MIFVGVTSTTSSFQHHVKQQVKTTTHKKMIQIKTASKTHEGYNLPPRVKIKCKGHTEVLNVHMVIHPSAKFGMPMSESKDDHATNSW